MTTHKHRIPGSRVVSMGRSGSKMVLFIVYVMATDSDWSGRLTIIFESN